MFRGEKKWTLWEPKGVIVQQCFSEASGNLQMEKGRAVTGRGKTDSHLGCHTHGKKMIKTMLHYSEHISS